MRVVAHQLGALGAQLCDLDRQRAVVTLTRRRPQAVAVEQLFTQLPVFGLHHERLVGRAVQTDNPGFFLVIPDSRLEVVAQAGDLVIFGEFQRECLRFQQQILRELCGQCRHLGVDFGYLVLQG